jgi:hypothetical protein
LFQPNTKLRTAASSRSSRSDIALRY